jgi:hypothetical protein
LWRAVRRHLPRADQIMLALIVGSTVGLSAVPWWGGTN